MKRLRQKTLWWNGPSEIELHKHEIDQRNIDSIDLPSEIEVKKLTSTNVTSTTSVVQPIIDITRFSSLRKLLRVIAYVLQFLSRLKSRKMKDDNIPTDQLSAAELNSATIYWIKVAQVELDSRKLTPIIDEDGIARYNGRLGEAPIPYNARHPTLLAPNHTLTKLIVLDVHQRICHAWVKDTLTELRQQYWMPKGRSFVRKMLFNCLICRRCHAKSYDYPKSPPLTSLRTQDSRAFCVTGIDNFGPIHVKEVSNTQGLGHIVHMC